MTSQNCSYSLQVILLLLLLLQIQYFYTSVQDVKHVGLIMIVTVVRNQFMLVFFSNVWPAPILQQQLVILGSASAAIDRLLWVHSMVQLAAEGWPSVSSSFMFPQTPTRVTSLPVWGSAVWHLIGLTDRTHVLTPEQNQWWTLNVFKKCTEDDEARDWVSYK